MYGVVPLAAAATIRRDLSLKWGHTRDSFSLRARAVVTEGSRRCHAARAYPRRGSCKVYLFPEPYLAIVVSPGPHLSATIFIKLGPATS